MKCLRPQRDTSDHEESVSRPADGILKGSAIISVPDDKIISIGHGEQAPSPAEPTSENTDTADQALGNTVKPAEEADIASAPSSEAAQAKDGLEHISLPDVSAHSLSEMEESIASDAEASSEAAGDEYERRDIQSLSSGDLDCTSTPVAIGQDPFAKCSDTHGAAGPFRYRCSKAGSRPGTPEGHRQDALIIEHAVSLVSSPSLPRPHSRPYTPLQHSPQPEHRPGSSPSAPTHRAGAMQRTTLAQALWQGSTAAQNGGVAANGRSLDPCSGSEDKDSSQTMTKGAFLHERSQPGAPDNTGSLDRMQIDLSASDTKGSHGVRAHAQGSLRSKPAGILHPEAARPPSSGLSTDWASQGSSASQHGDEAPARSAQGVARLQQELDHAQPAELHYLGTIARLSARLESSLAKEAALKQRLQQLQASASRQLSASSTGVPSLGSVTSSQQAPQSHPQQEPRPQKLIVSQPEQQQQQEQGVRPASAGHAAGRRGSLSTEGQTRRQEASSALEQELGAVKVSLATAESELRDLRRAPSLAGEDRAAKERDVQLQLLTGARDDTKEVRAELEKAMKRTEHFAAETRSADQMVMRLKHETAELKAALEASKSDGQHSRQQLRAANLELKGAAAGEQEVKSECNSLRLALDAARLAVTNRDTECARLQQSLHASRAEMAELAAKHRQLERSMVAGQLLTEAAGRRSTLITGPDLQHAMRPATQPGLSPSTPGHAAPTAPAQADRRWSATSFGTTAYQNGGAAGQHPNNAHYDSVPNRAEQRQAPFWQEEAAGFPSSTALLTNQHPSDLGMAQPAGTASRAVQKKVGRPFATAEEGKFMGGSSQLPHVHSAAARTPMHAAGRRSIQSISPPFARSQDAISHDFMGAAEPQHMAAPAAGKPGHAHGRQNRNSISTPYATADDSAHIGQSGSQSQSREVSPPYATQEDAYLGTSADSPLIRAQARAILDGGSPHSNAPQGHAGAQQGSTKQHVLHMRPGAEADQESSAQDADRANLVDESVSSRHTTTGFRPYANEASLQDFRAHAQMLEHRLMTISSEQQQLHAEYARMPETSAGRTIAERRRRAEVESWLDGNSREASNIRLQLKRLNAQTE